MKDKVRTAVAVDDREDEGGIIWVAGGGGDEIGCGPGYDKAVVDGSDLLANCETVVRR